MHGPGPPGDDDLSSVTQSLAAGWAVAVAEPTPVGEVLMLVGTAAATVYYGPALIEGIRGLREGEGIDYGPLPKPWYTDRPNDYIQPNNYPYGSGGDGKNWGRWIGGAAMGLSGAYGKYKYNQMLRQTPVTPKDNTDIRQPVIRPNPYYGK